MTKAELVDKIAEEAGITKKQADAAVKSFTGAVVSEVAKGGEVALVGFGTFKSAERAGRTGRDPRTGKELEIPARTVPAFKAGKAFKDAVNG